MDKKIRRLNDASRSGKSVMETLEKRLVNKYDKEMYNQFFFDYYGQSDFYNLGYWTKQTQYPKEACENLMEKLLDYLSEKKDNILDVACGKGATSRYLTKYYPPSDIVGINISQKQLETCRINMPESEFIQMNATNMNFDDSTFDNIICVEAAFHFSSREKFLEETLRVLKPGGHLLLSDMLFVKFRKGDSAENYVKNINEYKKIFDDLGFIDVEVIDTTKESWGGHRKAVMKWMWDKFRTGKANLKQLIYIDYRLIELSLKLKHYLLVHAKKP